MEEPPLWIWISAVMSLSGMKVRVSINSDLSVFYQSSHPCMETLMLAAKKLCHSSSDGGMQFMEFGVTSMALEVPESISALQGTILDRYGISINMPRGLPKYIYGGSVGRVTVLPKRDGKSFFSVIRMPRKKFKILLRDACLSVHSGTHVSL